jgi:hypothetical protein
LAKTELGMLTNNVKDLGSGLTFTNLKNLFCVAESSKTNLSSQTVFAVP